ncbi:M23 family metallopeptidase [Novosphingobium sp. B 225]|uniref:M23 family metallopeptidase n=1 Tax=Novosphingobium sp. B 225 TaxID=1961849 RepID=UPI0020CE0C5A|nr:M23 family metallopeptidase [Novosphingobium sp. B 225]
MVAIALFAKFRSVAALAAAAASLAFPNLAMANSAAANADITAPLREARAAKVVPNNDEEFRRLFAGWKSLDARNGAMVTPVMTASKAANPGLVTTPMAPAGSTFAVPTRVAIPSINPVGGAALTSGFGQRWHPVLGGRRAHKGVDLAQPTGTPVRATADGVVSKADWFSSYGLYVSLEHGGNIETRYGHMSRLNVAAGQNVRKGDVIGYVGSTGRSTGPHLHYEVRIAGTAVSPIPYMQGGSAADVAIDIGGSK